MPDFKVIKTKPNHYQVEGELTFFTLGKKCLQPFDFLDSGQLIVLDLKAVTSADSAGLALVIELVKQGKRHQTTLQFNHIPLQLITLAGLSGLNLEQDL